MFESRINTIVEEIIAIFEVENAPIKFADLFSRGDLPDYIKAYFKAELVWIIYKEKINIQSNLQTFSQSNEEQLSTFQTKLMLSLELSLEEFRKHLLFGTQLFFNHAIRPLFTIEHYLFDNNFSRYYEVVEFRLGYLNTAFKNYNEIAMDFISCLKKENQVTMISKDNFMQIILDANSNLFNDIDSFDLSNLFEPMKTCFTDNDGNLALPIDAILIFFDDLRNEQIYDFVKAQKKSKKLDILNQDDLQIMINDIFLFLEEERENMKDELDFDDLLDDMEMIGSDTETTIEETTDEVQGDSISLEEKKETTDEDIDDDFSAFADSILSEK